MSVKVHVQFTVQKDADKFKAKAMEVVKTSKVRRLFFIELFLTVRQFWSGNLLYYFTTNIIFMNKIFFK